MEFDFYKIDNKLFPRYFISNKEEYFYFLYDFTTADKEILDMISHIIFTLTTNKSVFKRIILLNETMFKIKLDEFSILVDVWEGLLNPGNTIKYIAMILDFIMS